jgi:hypothetical protein
MQVPLPLSTVPEVVQQVIAHTSQRSRHSFSTSGGMCVSLLSVVTGLTPPSDVCYSQRFHCPSCGQLTDTLTTQSSLPCCNIPKTEWLKEDITGRCAGLSLLLASQTGDVLCNIQSLTVLVVLAEAVDSSCAQDLVCHTLAACILMSCHVVLGHCPLVSCLLCTQWRTCLHTCMHPVESAL